LVVGTGLSVAATRLSSTAHGNDVAIRAQADKLRLVVELAHEVWGAS
jgi:uncharacterized protein (DUF2345 family)